MANKDLFRAIRGKLLRNSDAHNNEGSIAYKMTPEHALAQLAMTGCFGHTFYVDAGTQLDRVLELCEEVSPDYVARLAIYSRTSGYMKDMPALLCAWLAARDTGLFKEVFPQVIDNGKMLRNFVQIMRSGVTGRKSLGTRPKRLVQQWIAGRPDAALFRDSVGTDPSLADIIKMVHPRPIDDRRRALYGYLIDRPYEADKLPEIVKAYEAFKADPTGTPPNVEFRKLTSLPLNKEHWAEIARNAGWQMTRMNLNTFLRNGVFEDRDLVRLVAERLRDSGKVEKARAFPYQLMAAFMNADKKVPKIITEALQDAMEIAIRNVPSVNGRVVVCPDVSGSMKQSVTGWRRGSASRVRCVDVAALVAAAIVRKNPETRVLPFEHRVVDVKINPRDSVMTNSAKLSSVGGGGTDCSAPLHYLNSHRMAVDLVVFISDNESWVDNRRRGATGTMQQWQELRAKNPGAKMVCIDVAPYDTSQAYDRADILNIGGFSDHVFKLVTDFANGSLDDGRWQTEIESVELQVVKSGAA
jgi:60 kDa SS-A/Ro ribonucleoprotein